MWNLLPRWGYRQWNHPPRQHRRNRPGHLFGLPEPPMIIEEQDAPDEDEGIILAPNLGDNTP